MFPRVSGAYIVARTTVSGERRFHVKYRRGGRYTMVEHAGAFKTKKEATLRRDLVREILARGENPRLVLEAQERPVHTFVEAASEWLASRHDVSAGTMRGYEHRLPVLTAKWKGGIDEITPRAVNAWIGELAADYRPGTTRLFVTQLRLILDHADVPTNAARDRRVQLPRVVRAEPDPPDRAAVEHLARLLERPERVAMLTMEQLGSRVSETLALHQDDLDGLRVRFRRETTKTRQGRWVEAPSVLVDALEETLPFKLSRDTLRRRMRQHSTVNPHALRHRRATLWHQQGVEAVELARRLGHAKPSMSLDVYANVKRLSEVHDLAALLR